MSKTIYIILFSSILLGKCQSERILSIFPAPIRSHQIVFKTLTQELARKGHRVTVITSMPVKTDLKVENYTEIDLSHIGNEFRDEVFKKLFKEVPDFFSQFTTALQFSFKVVDLILDTKEVHSLIAQNSFDLILIEDCARSAIILSHLLKAPVISISSFGGSFGSFSMMGGAIHPILYPLATKEKFVSLSMWDKITDLYTQYRFQKIQSNLEILHDNINKKKYGLQTPTLSKLKENVQLLFLNIHPIWDSNRPVPPNVIYLGGLHKSPQKELPKNLKHSLDSSKNGAIYISFGTNVDPSVFSSTTQQIFINVFSKLPYDVFWKWDEKIIAEMPKNIKISNWFPQFDVLRHPNVKLFITQGGLQSTDEAIDAAVPLIGIPILWDQWYNVDKYVQLKIGIKLDIKTITEEKLRNAIETVIGNEEYCNNIKHLRSLMLDSPQTSLERAVWWTEFVLRHRVTHLRTPSANMSWMEYYEITLIFVLISVLLISATVFLLLLKCTFKMLFNKFYAEKLKIY